MRKEVVELERLRQEIEQAEFEAGDKSDYIDYGKPNEKQLEQAKKFIAKKNEETKLLMSQLKDLLLNTSQDIVDEWVNWHKSFLQPIMDETNDKVRVHVAKQTWADWENVALRKQEFVRINWYYLKDYKAMVKKQLPKKHPLAFWK